MNPFIGLSVLLLVLSGLFGTLLFAGYLSDWKVSNVPRYRKVAPIVGLVYSVLFVIFYRYRFLNQPPKGGPTVQISPASDPQLIHVERPTYPAWAARHGLQGSVRVKLSIDSQGHVTAVQLLDGPKFLFDATSGSLFHWRYVTSDRNEQKLATIQFKFVSGKN